MKSRKGKGTRDKGRDIQHHLVVLRTLRVGAEGAKLDPVKRLPPPHAAFISRKCCASIYKFLAISLDLDHKSNALSVADQP